MNFLQFFGVGLNMWGRCKWGVGPNGGVTYFHTPSFFEKRSKDFVHDTKNTRDVLPRRRMGHTPDIQNLQRGIHLQGLSQRSVAVDPNPVVCAKQHTQELTPFRARKKMGWTKSLPHETGKNGGWSDEYWISSTADNITTTTEWLGNKKKTGDLGRERHQKTILTFGKSRDNAWYGMAYGPD